VTAKAPRKPTLAHKAEYYTMRATIAALGALPLRLGERGFQRHHRFGALAGIDIFPLQPGQGLLRGHGTVRHRLEQRPYFFPIHLSASFALPLRKPCRSSVT